MSSTAVAAEAEKKVHLPADIGWDTLDKSRFFVLGAALFSGVSAVLYPAVVLKTRLQASQNCSTCLGAAASILRHEGPRGFYRGFATSLAGTVPARALYTAALEITRSAVGSAGLRLGLPDSTAEAAAGAAAGVSAAAAAQIVWTPVDVVSQRLMVGGSGYRGGADGFRKIVLSEGILGAYRGFGLSVLTYAPSNAVWWASYSVAQRIVWGWIGQPRVRDGSTAAAVQGLSAAMAGAASAIVTMPLDTVKTRMQVASGAATTVGRTARNLLSEGGWAACYRGMGPRWVSTSISAAVMITTYEFLKRLSAKNLES